jgi:hypothetical protein
LEFDIVERLDYRGLRAIKRAASMAAILFLLSILRIPESKIKHAKFVCISWRVSGYKSRVITLEFEVGA